ncbi:unnamed protein product [Vitrella brassicaformis CCMP3155]|uniref:Uncharacterized protein n=1 Tax=Vitrella brassicaformis (strain CCMP3155) TaxID=1169540 RepID=A0A0G4G7G7_VITBC|nr:unnamed protein product [Vitrella brassicaformis CCMP3155]|eukprot:CEM24576.1 unnamed protein product [Vitrella brassicaformis CCMP3155]
MSAAAAAAAAPAAADGRQATSAAAASDEDHRRAERDRELRQAIADTPGLVNCITAFLPLYLLGLLSTTAWDHAAPTHTHLTIDSTNSNERSVWQRVPLALVTQWAKKFTQLTAITLRYPVGNVVGKALWRIDVFITVIELNTTTLRTIAFIEGVRLAKREMMTVGSRRQQRPLRQIAPLVPPPSLDSLTTITGLRFPHRCLAKRGWRMPSLQCVEQQGWRADELGSFISSSRSLQHVGGRLWGPGERWASVFELMPEAATGQRGPLARLQSIGRIELRGNFDRVFHYACTMVDTLHAVLTSRGCTESLTQLVVLMECKRDVAIDIDSRILPLLHSIESLHSSCCQPNAEIVFEASSRRLQGVFDLSFLHADTFPSHPSLPLKMAIQAAARKSTQLEYFISQHDLSHPSQAAIDIANTLTFDNVERVWRYIPRLLKVASLRDGDMSAAAAAAAAPAAADGRQPGLVNCITAFLPLYLLGLLSTTAWDHAAPTHTHLTIDSTDSNERSVWQRVPLALVTQWANKLTRLTAISLRYPISAALWCRDVVVTVIENMPGGTLRTIALVEGVRLAGEEMMTVDFRLQQRPLRQIPPVVPPPSLDSLTTITGLLRIHRDLASRGWPMPSLETVEQEGWRADDLGSFISSSRSLQHISGDLQHVRGHLAGEEWASVFERMPEAAAGQPGPLAGLQSIGTIELRWFQARAAVDRLQAALASRGCSRSLTELAVVATDLYGFDSRVLPLLQSLNSCCRPDARVSFEVRRVHTFDLSLFYNDDFPLNLSPLVMTAVQAAALKAETVKYVISQHDFTHPVDSPSQAAIDIAKTLTFDNAGSVWVVHNALSFVPAPNTPSPLPAIIDHLQQFPSVRGLDIHSALGGVVGRLLAGKMLNKVDMVRFRTTVSAEDRRGVLEEVRAGREVDSVYVDAVSLTDGAFDGCLNPNINTEGFPVVFPSAADGFQLTRKNGGALVAGVSSFGFGGTNAHVILSSPFDAPEEDTAAA